MREVMEEYTRKFNELEGKSMSTEEFRCECSHKVSALLYVYSQPLQVCI